MNSPRPILRWRRAAVALALVAALTGQVLAAHGHGGASDHLAKVTAAAFEHGQQVGECAACVASANRHAPLAAQRAPLALAPLRLVSPAAFQQGAFAAHPLALPQERAPPLSA